MIAYVDASVLLRVVLRQRNMLSAWLLSAYFEAVDPAISLLPPGQPPLAS